jgi:hypothetical protein
MPDISEYRQGTPCWLDLWTPDRPKSMEFYAAVFGWDYRVASEDQHSFTEALVRGKNVAGIVSPPGATDMIWVTYLAADNLDPVLAAVTANGGVSQTGPIEIPGIGLRIALAADPTGGQFGILESRGHGGAEVANEPGALIWNELMTPDPATARAFYAAVFGVEAGAPMSEDFDYTTIRVAGRDVGGIGKSDHGGPAAWHSYFATADTDATAARVGAAGGSVLSQAMDTPYGRMARCADPHGSTFFLMSTTNT